jgi:ribonuclease HII
VITDPLYTYDLAAQAEGYPLVCGVDEAGRGPLAGPVYAAAVILPAEPLIKGLNDSKKLSPKRREALFEQIVEHASSFCIAEASVEEIDTMNILQASLLAMRRAVEGLDMQPNLVLTDGNQDPGFGLATRTVVGGDGASASIAAASILAKVARDRAMLELDAQYPDYNFAKHKGYGTKLHYEMLELHGPCPAHRKTFLRKWEASRG